MIRYMIYRVYSKLERPDDTLSERIVFYGWTMFKDWVKLFLKQRSKDKYQIVKVDDDKLTDDGDIPSIDTRLDSLLLISSQTNERIYIITTDKEIAEYESKIHQLFRDLSSLNSINGNGDYLNMIYNLAEKYKDALDFLGYSPREFEYIFPPSINADDEFETELRMNHNSIIDKISISVESFIKVMKDDM